MAKKKDKKGTGFLQTTYDIATAGVDQGTPRGGSTFDEAFAAAGGGRYGNPGAGNTGYSVNWSEVDFGKKTIEDLMKHQENQRNKKDIDARRKKCIEQKGQWNPTTGTCDKEGLKDDQQILLKKKACAKKDGYEWNDDLQLCVEIEGKKEKPIGTEEKECECNGEITRIPKTKDCPPCDDKPDTDECPEGYEKVDGICQPKKDTDGAVDKPCECNGEVTRVPISQDCPECDEPDPNQCAEDEYWDGVRCVKKRNQGKDVRGCTNPDSENYNPDATIDDGSC